MVLVLLVSDLHIPHRAGGLPEAFKSLLVPGRIQHVLCPGDLCNRSVPDGRCHSRPTSPAGQAGTCARHRTSAALLTLQPSYPIPSHTNRARRRRNKQTHTQGDAGVPAVHQPGRARHARRLRRPQPGKLVRWERQLEAAGELAAGAEAGDDRRMANRTDTRPRSGATRLSRHFPRVRDSRMRKPLHCPPRVLTHARTPVDRRTRPFTGRCPRATWRRQPRCSGNWTATCS